MIGRRLLALVVGLLGCGEASGERAPTAELTPVVDVAAVVDATTDYDRTLARLDRAVEGRLREAESHASWRREAAAAGALLARADLTGRYDDYAAAEAHLRRAFADARTSGPHLLRARFLLRMHRIAEAKADLATVATYATRDADTDAALAGLQADIAISEGRWDEARAALDALVARDRSTTNLARLAHLVATLGDDAQADALYVEALAIAQEPQSAAWIELQRGLLALDGGRLDDAAARYRAADARFSGWWLVQEHLAEIDALQGRVDAAIAAYRDLIARTENPEFMDALAEALADRDASESATWHARARAEYERRLAQFPAATYGHALEHFLQSPDGGARALELALANRELRPGPDADLRLAQAYARAGDAPHAGATMRRRVHAGALDAETLATAAVVDAMQGRSIDAREHARAAIAANPRIFAELAWLRDAVGACDSSSAAALGC